MTSLIRARALLIGNWAYTDPDMKLQPLRGPEKNLEIMAAALTDEQWGLCEPEQVTVLKNLTAQQMRDQLFDLAEAAQSDEALLIYYTGHGERLFNQQLGFCGVDAKGSRVEAGSFNSHDLKGWLTAYNRARSTVVVLDCCYSGQFMGAVDAPATLAESFGAGTAVLTSGGNELVPDAEGDGQPTRYTAALAKVLCDGEISGRGSFLSVDDVYDALDRFTPQLLPKPRRSLVGAGDIPLARREAVVTVGGQGSPLWGWREEQSFSTVEVAFTGDPVVVTWAGSSESIPLERFDRTRQAALRRLSQLADAVVRADVSGADAQAELAYAVRRTWECVGVNLFETAFPASLQEHIRANLGSAGADVIRVRLTFGGGAAALAQYPWEYLQLPPPPTQDPGRRIIPPPLALHAGLVVERALPAGSPVWDTRVEPGKRPIVGVVNALPHPYAEVGGRVAEELKALEANQKIGFPADLNDKGAGWRQFMDSTDHGLQYLLLYLPVRRNGGVAEVGFYQPVTPDWRTSGELAAELNRDARVRAVFLATVAAPPGRDSFRGAIQFANELSRALHRPLFFVCHQPGFERFVENLPEPRPETLWGLMLDALSRGKELHRSFWYARDQVDRRLSQELKSVFGVPGCFLPVDGETAAPAAVIGATSGSQGRGNQVAASRSKAVRR